MSTPFYDFSPLYQAMGSAWIFSAAAVGISQAARQNCSLLDLRDAVPAVPGLLEMKAPCTESVVQHRGAGHGAGGNCTFLTPLAVKGESWSLQLLYSMWEGDNMVKLDGGGTFPNKYTSEIFLKGHTGSITYKLSSFWRCPCTPTSKRSPVLLPTAVLSWAVEHSWPLHMDTLHPYRFYGWV